MLSPDIVEVLGEKEYKEAGIFRYFFPTRGTLPISKERTLIGGLNKVLLHDGEELHSYPVENSKVTSFDTGPDGRIWVGGYGCLGTLTPDPNGALTFRSLDHLITRDLKDSIRSYIEESDRGTYSEAEGALVHELHVEDQEEVYFYTVQGLLRYDGDSIRRVEGMMRFFRVGDRAVFRSDSGALYPSADIDSDPFPNSREFLEEGSGLFNIHPAPKAFCEKHGDGEELWWRFKITNGVQVYDPKEGEIRDLTEYLPSDHQPPERYRKYLGLEEDGEEKGMEVYSVVKLDPNRNPYGAAFAIGSFSGGYLIGPSGEYLLSFLEEGKDGSSISRLSLYKGLNGGIWVDQNDKRLLHISLGSPFTSMNAKERLDESQVSFPKKVEGGKLLFPANNKLFLWDEDRNRFEEQYQLEEKKSFRSFLSYGGQEEVRGEQGQGSYSAFEGLLGKVRYYDHRKGIDERGVRTFRNFGKEEGLEINTLMRGYDWAGLRKIPREGTQDVLLVDTGKAVLFGIPELSGEFRELMSIQKPEGSRSGHFSIGDHVLLEKDYKPDSIRIWKSTFASMDLRLQNKAFMHLTVDTGFTSYNFTRYDTSNGLPAMRAQAFQGPEGDVHVFSDSGLYRYDNGDFVPSTPFGGLLAEKEGAELSVHEGYGDEYWVKERIGEASNGFGAYRTYRLYYRDSAYVLDSMPFKAHLGNRRVGFSAEEDRVWFGSEWGEEELFLFHRDLEVNYDHPEEVWIKQVRTANDSTLFGGWYGSYPDEEGVEDRDSSGNVWQVEPLEEQPEEMAPSIPYYQELPNYYNRISFDFAAAHPGHQEDLRYRYKLEGFDTAWSEPTRTQSMAYYNLPFGEYSFKVKALNAYERESSVSTYNFEVLPPWYRTWTAYGGYSMGSVLFIWLLIRLNARRLLKQKQELERNVAERTKEVREKNSSLKQANKDIQEQKERVEEAHAEITHSIDYAQKIQQALLHSEEHLAEAAPEHFFLLKPQVKVSGDFYWAREHKGYFYIAAVDCTGHGVPGAFMSMLGISQLNEVFNTDEELSPGVVLTRLRDRVVRELRSADPESGARDGMDAALVKIPIPKSQNPSEEEVEVQFAGANNPLYAIREGITVEIEKVAGGRGEESSDASRIKPFRNGTDGIEVKGDKQPVGFSDRAEQDFTTVQLKLKKGDMLYLFSDGYADQFGGPKGKKFRYGPFKKLLKRVHQKGMEEQREELDRVIEEWRLESDQEQIDDVLVIGVRV